jgi:hypothetical protein
MDKSQKERKVIRTFSMNESESQLIEMMNEQRRYRNSSLAFRQILREWEEYIWKAGKSVEKVS